MKSAYRLFIFVFVVSVAPALFACEDCYLPGMTTPIGKTLQKAQCWSSPEGVSEGCLPYEDGSNCHLWSYGNSCPEESDDGGGSPGGGGGGTGGGDCSTTTGVCPPECPSCGGGSGGGFLY